MWLSLWFCYYYDYYAYDYDYCNYYDDSYYSDFRYESNGIFVLGVVFFFFRQISTF